MHYCKTMLFLASLLLTGCSDNPTTNFQPNKDDLDAAFSRAITTLNEKTKSQLDPDFEIYRIEVPKSCHQHLDYFAQQVLWAMIYHEEVLKKKKSFNISCTSAAFYK